jgi:hypothetical protein
LIADDHGPQHTGAQMLWALSFAQLIWIVATPSVATFVAIALIRHRRWKKLISESQLGSFGREIFSSVTGTITVVVFLFTALDYTSWWRLAWTPNRLINLNALVFPDLNGRWHGSLISNRKGEGQENGSCPELDPSERTVFGCYSIDVTISMSLFSTKIRLELGSTNSESKGVSLVRDSDEVHVMYLFVASPPVGQSFNGAAILDGKVDHLRNLTGHYWTDRGWETNKQTAGHVTLERTGT